MNTETTEVQQDENEKPDLQLKVDVKETSACEREVTVTIPREDINRYFQEQFDELVPKAEVPGFRAGRAPRNLVESMFRKQVADQVKGSLLMDSLSQISEQQDFSAISEPDLDFEDVTIPEEGDLTYTFDIEVRPEFDLPEWKGLSLERPEHEFSEDEIDKRIQQLARSFSDLAPIEEPVQLGDVITCDVVARHDGKTVSEKSEVNIQVAKTLSLSDCTVEKFDELVAGAKADDTRTTTVEISKFSENEDLQGQEVELEFKILDVKRIEEKPLDEVAAKLGLDDAKSMRDLIEKSMQDQLQYAQREKVREQINQLLTESADWELPPDLLRRQSRREIERAMIELHASGFSESEVVARQNRLRKNILERTEVLLKEHFILERIAEEESIEEEPQDYDMEIARIAIQQQDSPRRVRAKLERTGQMDALRNMIIERKVIDLITEHAEFKAVPYERDDESADYAVEFFAAGDTQQIPEAKYEDGPEMKPLPTQDS